MNMIKRVRGIKIFPQAVFFPDWFHLPIAYRPNRENVQQLARGGSSLGTGDRGFCA